VHARRTVALASFVLAAAASQAHASSNGYLSQSELAPIYQPNYRVYLQKDAAAAWNAFRQYCLARGVDVYPGGQYSAYRTYSQQVLMKRLYGSNAATPGTSNHGLGLAVDLATQQMRSAVDKWGAQFGWSKRWSDASWEWWHIKYQAGHYHGGDPGPGDSPATSSDGLPSTPDATTTAGDSRVPDRTPSAGDSSSGAATDTTPGSVAPPRPTDTSGIAAILGDVSSRSQISRGSKGKDVEALQKALNARGYSIVEDGDFGHETELTVKHFQKSHGLPADGIVGPKTWKALSGS